MNKKRRMLMLTDGNIDNASARIRAIQYIPYLQKEGFRITLIPRIPKKSANFLWKFFFFPILKRWHFVKRWIKVRYFRWEFVFIQRTFISEVLLKALKNRGIPILFDFDDAIYINKKKPENEGKTGLMIRYADYVVVSTDFLKPFCQKFQKEPIIIPSPIEIDRIKPVDRSNHAIPVIGWMGSAWTTDFLRIVVKPLQDLAKKYTFRFLTVGAREDFEIDGVELIRESWSFEEENLQIAKMDLGIMPLPDNEWARSKGGYKLLQYMSGGIPCVASPVGINQSIVKNGINGYLASTEEEWFGYFEKLIVDPDLRVKMGQLGRKDAEELYSREVCFRKLIPILGSKI